MVVVLKMPSYEQLIYLGVIGLIFSVSLTNGALLPIESPSSNGESRDIKDGRLPGGFIPSHYDIEIAPDIYHSEPPFNFTGHVVIFLRCNESSSSITLNSEGLSIIDVSVQLDPNSTANESPNLNGWTVNNAVAFLTLNFSEPLIASEHYVINVTYSGVLANPTTRGIYYDLYYDDDNNVTRYMVATQLESIFARRMFPCFDEPDLKATFSVVVLRKEPMISLSNMNQIGNETRDNDWIADYYAKTPIMSTYLLCVCIGDFVYVESDWQNYTSHPIRIYSRPQMKENLKYAAKIAPVIHAWLEHETGVAYELPKMDHIALPSKGGSAMENWGLITYGESALCFNDKKSAATGKMGTVSIVAHELAHQWYGNIITTKWWDDIWLNEGFANHYNYYPQYSLGWPGSQAQHFRGTQPFLDIDQRNNSDPVIKDINTSDKAPSAFTGSTYPKGGAIVRMIKGMLTRKTMNEAFTKYLNKFHSASVTSDDLWQVLTEQAEIDKIQDQNGKNIDFKTIMDPWMKQMGYPLVKVTNAGDGTASVTASRYFNPRAQSPDTASDFNYQWTIPVTVATEGTKDWENLRPQFYVHSEQESTKITGLPVGLDKWFVINANQMFFYRVDYDANTRAAIVKQLLTDPSKISSESRGQLVDDSFSLSRSLVINETAALETTRYLRSELQYNAWNVALKHLLYADKIFQKFSWYSLYKSYMTGLLVPVYQQTGWDFNDNEPAIDQYLRKDISTTTCYYGHADCRTTAKDLYNTAMQNSQNDSVDPNNLPNVLCVGVNGGADTDWHKVFDEYQRRRSSPFNDERYAYLYGLSCTQQLPLLHTYLEHIVGGVKIDSRDQTTALNYLIQNSNDGRNIVWTYLRNNWASVPSTISKFTVLRNVASTWYRDSDLYDFNQFVSTNSPFGETNTNLIVQIQLLVEQNIDWFNANADAVEKWLTTDVETTTESTGTAGTTTQWSTTSPTETTTQWSTSQTENSTHWSTFSDTENTTQWSTNSQTETTAQWSTLERETTTQSSSCRRQVNLLAIPLSVLNFVFVYLI